MLPGETTLTRMLCGANSEASPRAMPISPIFAADKCVRPLPLAEIAPSPQKNRMAPVAILYHRLDHRARQVQRTVKNHTPDQLPIRIGRFGERLVRPDRGVVDQDVDPAELG